MSTTTSRKPTTARQAMNACRKAGMKVDRVTVQVDHRTFTVRSEHAAKRVAKITGWGWFTTAWGGYVMTGEYTKTDVGNCQ